jgi:hypothetical protein
MDIRLIMREELTANAQSMRVIFRGDVVAFLRQTATIIMMLALCCALLHLISGVLRSGRLQPAVPLACARASMAYWHVWLTPDLPHAFLVQNGCPLSYPEHQGARGTPTRLLHAGTRHINHDPPFLALENPETCRGPPWQIDSPLRRGRGGTREACCRSKGIESCWSHPYRPTELHHP